MLTDRASLLRAYFRLVDSSLDDDDMIEHDGSTLEGAYEALQGGLEDARLFMVGEGAESQWIKTTAALSVTGSGLDRVAALPADFMRLYGRDGKSALWYGAGLRWGQLVDSQERFLSGNGYYVEGTGTAGLKQLHFLPHAAIPASLFADYVSRPATLADSTTVDFPEEDRALIPAFAAIRATAEAWYTGDSLEETRLVRHLDALKRRASRRVRVSRAPKQVDVPRARGRWYL